MATCRLCLKYKELKHSHVLPEFLYAPMYDDKHRFNIMSNVHGVQKRQEQKGLREYLLCNECEGQLNVWETYAANLLYEGDKRATGDLLGSEFIVEGVDYPKLKLFMMSLIWRAGIASHKVFSETTLGPHEEKLRNMLYRGDSGPPEKYGCLVYCVTHNGAPLDGTIYGPSPCWVESHRCYRLLAKSFLYIFYVTSHDLDPRLKAGFVTPAGRLIIPVREITQLPFLKSLCIELAERIINPPLHRAKPQRPDGCRVAK